MRFIAHRGTSFGYALKRDARPVVLAGGITDLEVALVVLLEFKKLPSFQLVLGHTISIYRY